MAHLYAIFLDSALGTLGEGSLERSTRERLERAARRFVSRLLMDGGMEVRAAVEAARVEGFVYGAMVAGCSVSPGYRAIRA